MKIATYFFHYQLPVASCVIISVAISHFFVQRAFDKKDKNINHEQAEQKLSIMSRRSITPFYL